MIGLSILGIVLIVVSGLIVLGNYVLALQYTHETKDMKECGWKLIALLFVAFICLVGGVVLLVVYPFC